MSQIMKRNPQSAEKNGKSNENDKNGTVSPNDDSGNRKYDGHAAFSFLTKKHWISYVLFSFFIYYVCFTMDGWLPKPLTDAEAGLDTFSEMRAMKHLQILSDYGPKPSGSYAAEVLTRNYIVDEATKIKTEMNVNFHNVEIGVQKPNGCFDFSFLSGFMLCYKNVTNIVVVLSPKTLTDHSILVNCHFDSVPASPGATDDLASCAIMLEMLSILSKSPSSLTHNVIFLFNGAEENFMQGAHGFITQHRLRHTIKAFINLEGAGAGGRELLFQSGPSNMWLLHAYLDSARYPHGSVMCQEIFESGVILSDTDYRVFRDYGRLSGLDIAYVKNGYLYHTEFDKASMIPAGSVQRAGENVLATLKTLANSPCLTRPCPSRDDRIVFFDILGMFIVTYSMKIAVFLNLLTVFLVAIKVYRQFRLAQQSKNEFKDKLPCDVDGYTVGDFVRQLITHVICLICIILSAVLLTKIVDFIDLTLTWYSQPILMLPLYLIPLVFVGYTVHLLVPKYVSYLKVNDPFRREQVTFDVSLSFMALILFVLTLLGVRSAYFLMAVTIFPLTRDPLRSLFVKFGYEKRNANLLYFCHWLTSVPGSILGAYAFVEVTTFFIPMMGRSCAKLNPEHFVSGLCALSTIFIVLFTVSLCHVSRGLAYLIKCGVALILLIVIVLALTPFGSPYKFDPEGPRWRRLHIQHVRRQFILEDGRNTVDNGVWIVSLDYRGVQDLPSSTFLQGSKTPVCLEEEEFCGLPYYLPLRQVIPADSTLWLAVPNPPTFTKPLSLKLLSKEKFARNKLNFTFSVDGPDHITMSISPLTSWRLDGWSFDKNPMDEQKTYFVYLAHVDVKEPWTFSIILRADADSLLDKAGKKVLISAATHELHGDNQYSETLKTIVRTVRQRRSEPELTKGHWKWAMTVDGWGSDYIAQHFG